MSVCLYVYMYVMYLYNIYIYLYSDESGKESLRPIRVGRTRRPFFRRQSRPAQAPPALIASQRRAALGIRTYAHTQYIHIINGVCVCV